MGEGLGLLGLVAAAWGLAGGWLGASVTLSNERDSINCIGVNRCFKHIRTTASGRLHARI